VTEAYPLRPAADYAAEQQFLNERVLEIEKGMGRVAAREPVTMPIPQRMDALDRARELTLDLFKQVRVRPLEDAVGSQLAWLDAAEARLALADGEPKVGYNRIALDRRLLSDLLELWRAQRN
jgi:hypothetical protein